MALVIQRVYTLVFLFSPLLFSSVQCVRMSGGSCFSSFYSPHLAYTYNAYRAECTFFLHFVQKQKRLQMIPCIKRCWCYNDHYYFSFFLLLYLQRMTLSSPLLNLLAIWAVSTFTFRLQFVLVFSLVRVFLVGFHPLKFTFNETGFLGDDDGNDNGSDNGNDNDM